MKKRRIKKKKEDHLMSKVDIRVGKIVNIFPNEEGDKLYNEEIDIGNGEIRKIASRVWFYVLKQKIKNIKNVLRPPQGSQPGDLVYIGDLLREPIPVKNALRIKYMKI